MPATPSETPSPRAQRSRRRILEAAGRCLAAEGFARTTVEQIASTAGVSKALVYHHFRGKQEILEAVLEDTLADWERLTRVDFRAGNSVLECVAELHRASVSFARDRPVVRALFRLDPSLILSLGSGAAVREALARFRDTLTGMLKDGVETGELRADLDSEHTAHVLLVLTLALMDRAGSDGIDAADPRILAASRHLLLYGIAGHA